MEDTDLSRVREEYFQQIFEDLDWLGLGWEGDVILQSSRLMAYQEAIDKLQDLGVIYPCFCTRKEIEQELSQMPAAPHDWGNPYPGTCRRLSKDERDRRLQDGVEHCLRLDLMQALEEVGSVDFIESGTRISIDPRMFGDIVIMRKDSVTAYHLACVIDDAFQGVDLVTRGRDLLEATSIQRVLQELLELPQPEYRHHKLVVDDQGKRLAKRYDALSIRSLREQGQSPEAVIALAQGSLE